MTADLTIGGNDFIENAGVAADDPEHKLVGLSAQTVTQAASAISVAGANLSEAAEPAEVQPKNPEAGGQSLPGVTHYTDGYAYEVPRPFLTLQQAANILGKSLRSLERSLLGRWGSKLPEGWVARKMRTQNGEEWRILPPPGFRVKLNSAGSYAGASGQPVRSGDSELSDYTFNGSNAGLSTGPDDGDTAGSGSITALRRRVWSPERHTIEQPTIVIDRTEEVERLLRELLVTQKALSEERRSHMDDLRMISQLQGSLRLLEVNSAEQARAKGELEATKQELSAWKEKYLRITNLPWWRRLFRNDL